MNTKDIAQKIVANKDVIIKRSLIVAGTVVAVLVVNTVLAKVSPASDVTVIEGDVIIDASTPEV